MKPIASFLARLSSRKFLLTVGGIVAVTLYPENATQIVALIVAFIGAEGAGDVVERYATQKTAQTKVMAGDTETTLNDLSAPVDRSGLVSGADIPAL